MSIKAMKVVVELQLKAVSCPGVRLTAKDDIYLSLCFMNQYRKSECVPPVFPLLFRERMTFEKIFKHAVDPGDVALLLEDQTINIELVQLIPPVGETLACFDEDARQFLFPEPKLVPSYSGVDREVLMTREFSFPGIAPRLEFATRTTISECPADAEPSFHWNVPMRTVPKKRATKRSVKQKCSSPRRTGSSLLVSRAGRTDGDSPSWAPAAHRSRSLPPDAASRLGRCHETTQRMARLTLDSQSPSWADATSELRPGHMRGSWPRAGRSSSPSHALTTKSQDPSSPRALSRGLVPGETISTDTEDHLANVPGDGKLPSFSNLEASNTSPSVLWRSYREHSSQNGSHSSSREPWEEVQKRVRGLLTSPGALHRLVYGATNSEIDGVLARRSISPCPPS